MANSDGIPSVPDWWPLYVEDAPEIMVRPADLPIILLRMLWKDEPSGCYHHRLIRAATVHFGLDGREPMDSACAPFIEQGTLREVLRWTVVNRDRECYLSGPVLWSAFYSLASLPRTWDNVLSGSFFYRDRRGYDRQRDDPPHPIAEMGWDATLAIYQHGGASIELMAMLAPILMHSWGYDDADLDQPAVSIVDLLPGDPEVTGES